MDTNTFTGSYIGHPDEYRDSATQWAYKITRDAISAIASGLLVYGVLRTAFAIEAVNSTLQHHITS